MSSVFDFRRGHSIRGLDPQQVGDELERIRSENGILTPDAVVEAAKAGDSPLHGAFTWSDSEAAHKHRLNQARQLIVSIRVVNSPIRTPVPAYVSVRTPEKGRSYMPTVDALTDEQMKARVLDEVRAFVESLERRYAAFAEVADMLAGLRQKVA